MFKKIICVSLIISFAFSLGCIDDKKDINDVSEIGIIEENVSDDTKEGVTTNNYNEKNAVVYDSFRLDKHNETVDILNSFVGNDVKINGYARGNLTEVGYYFIVVDSDVIGTCYINIDSINLISIANRAQNSTLVKK